MASSGHRGWWEAPTFHFNSANQSEDWTVFYTRALDYLNTLDIELEEADESHKGWKQLKLMFEGEDTKALQNLIDNGVMTTEHMKTPKAALDAITTTIKLKEHFWAHKDELVSDLWQQPDEGIHPLSQCICDLLTKSKFTHAPTLEMLKIMVLQHAVRYHEARDWIRHQDQSQLTYQALLSHCKMLELQCEQFQKAKERGHTDLASITTTTSSLHMDALSISSKHCCKKCGYSHPNTKYPAKGQQYYACSGNNHFTVLCLQKGHHQNTKQTLWRGYQPRYNTSSHHRCCTSCSPHRHCCKSPSHCSHSRPLPTVPHVVPPVAHRPSCSAHLNMCSIPHRYYQDALEVIAADSITTGSWAEGQLYMESTSDGQVAFYTCLHLPAQNGTNDHDC